MGSIARYYIRCIDLINKFTGWSLAVMLATMSILIFWQVFARFVVGNSLTFSEELSRFLMIWMTLLGMAYAYRKGMLISVDLLPDIVSHTLRKWIKIAVYMLSFIFAVVLVIFGWDMAQAVSSQTAPSTRISMFWPMLALPIGGLLIFLNSIVLIIEELSGGRDKT
ncbi:TRAP-type C4-dicarboxylate transport system permease small subunit [Caldalkalibacillus uzonensis]|uniref:TRAP-type C4-dicarboxylate transport system permease small subunit n=1 Tax=Caldalkalibacillus uzonensis TaxID=353224 RepID=A0ABU0CPD9_9BACI|nr:TRAP transporter small permease [Caldalkalibacillus uzonensis]MDQ0337365.1 TRAP-type C4-dicarboxylate transport system permease small subunit [Caldalkalibacillus uzonensis]